MDFEKTLAFKRAFIGYSTMSVLEKIHSIQEKNRCELTELRGSLQIEREMRGKLTEEVELTRAVPETNPTRKTISPVVTGLIEQLVRYNKSIEELEKGLEEQESIYKQELELKKQQKYHAKKRIQAALLFLQTSPGTETEFQKKQRV